jgi:hypothetical protein
MENSMQPSYAPPPGEQELSPEEQFFALLPLTRLMIEQGLRPLPDFGLFEFDATALFFAHSAGRMTLSPGTLRAVTRISRGEGYKPNQSVRREIEVRARELFSRSTTILQAMSSSAHQKGEEQSHGLEN